MNATLLEKQLKIMNSFEQKYSGTPEKPNSFSTLIGSELVLSPQNEVPDVVPTEYFFKPEQNVVFLKHPRYIKFSTHSHSFIEMNYVLSGTCKQMINGKEVMLKEGDLCLLDTNVTHAIDQAGENDIVINIMIRTSYFDSALLRRLSGNDLLTDFFVNTIYKHKEDSRYIIFSKHSTSKLRELILQALLEYSNPQLCSKEAINSYMLLIFTELVRIYHDSPHNIDQPVMKKGIISEILDYMEKNYDTLTLDKTAEYFHFHPNHLTRLLKTNLNKTFIDLSHQLKIKNACTMLENTDLTVDQIANKTGYTNITFFYKTFKKFHGVTPAKYRKENQRLNQ
ncbi:AraC family transcriptional regulator [Metabacillus halosaccharovorans]|uniref:AraC family transcriptional regulator n=1 Tax=Metabacillus halosaccharovorans TaxID=930124 RepID=UPI00203E3B63|nr:AraC family transcriptional regulator [Metabacillus halosaccharovorans]MCM3444266.1 AraC family transcriptional regulator [Metabacillus halosaccharovorans]